MSRPTDKDHTQPEPMFKRRIVTFVKREGRFTEAQKKAFEDCWSEFGIDYTDTTLSLNSLFKNDHPVILEIGFGNGDSLAQMAIANPDKNYIGIEVHRPGAGQLLMQIRDKNIQNIRISTHDAIQVVTNQLVDNALSGVQIFFPDPWPKKRHHKRRIVQPVFMSLLAKKLKPQGFVHLATDWAPYAERMLEVMQSHPDYKNTVADYIERPESRPLTKFEQRGLKLGHQIFDLMFEKQ